MSTRNSFARVASVSGSALDYTSNVFVQESNIVADYLDTMAQKGAIVDIHDILLKFTLDSFGE